MVYVVISTKIKLFSVTDIIFFLNEKLVKL